MSDIEREVVVSCPPDRVFDVLSNVERLTDFSEMTVAVNNGPGRAVQSGDRFEQVVKVAGVELETEWQVLEVSTAGQVRSLRFEGTSQGDVRATVTHRLVPEGSGTRVTFTVEYDPPYGVLGEIADKLLFERRNEKDAERILGRLKDICESPA
jgi:ligand-binding SRPBCC domain-containing protein